MQKLNLPTYKFQLQINEDGKRLIFDEIRKKYVALTPEEWVRQNFLKYLIIEKKYPKSLISVEMQLYLNNISRRSDIVVFSQQAKPKVIVECKSANVKINNNVFEQIKEYNIKLKVDFLIITNGLKHYCCKVDYENNKCIFLEDIPSYKEVLSF